MRELDPLPNHEGKFGKGSVLQGTCNRSSRSDVGFEVCLQDYLVVDLQQHEYLDQLALRERVELLTSCWK